MEALAKEAGVSNPLVYRYFSRRRVLFQELLDLEFDRYRDDLQEQLDAARTFEDIVRLFGKRVDDHDPACISLLLNPLPIVPILIRYWKPEEGMESGLRFLFDSTATANLNIESIYTLAAGLVAMFEKIAQRHGLTQRRAR